MPTTQQTSARPLLLIEEAIEGFAAPNRFDEGEAVIACVVVHRGLIKFLLAIVCCVDRYGYTVRSLDGHLQLQVAQFDLLKLAAVENSAAS